jgi:hypothetical protein
MTPPEAAPTPAPAGGHHRPHAGDRQHAEAREQPSPAADDGADGGAGSGLARRRIGGDIAIVGIVRHQADVVMRDTSRFQILHRLDGIVIAVVELRDCPGGHVASQ